MAARRRRLLARQLAARRPSTAARRRLRRSPLPRAPVTWPPTRSLPRTSMVWLRAPAPWRRRQWSSTARRQRQPPRTPPRPRQLMRRARRSQRRRRATALFWAARERERARGRPATTRSLSWQRERQCPWWMRTATSWACCTGGWSQGGSGRDRGGLEMVAELGYWCAGGGRSHRSAPLGDSCRRPALGRPQLNAPHLVGPASLPRHRRRAATGAC